MSWKTNYVYYNMIIQQQSALILEWPKEKKEKKTKKNKNSRKIILFVGPQYSTFFLFLDHFFDVQRYLMLIYKQQHILLITFVIWKRFSAIILT